MTTPTLIGADIVRMGERSLALSLVIAVTPAECEAIRLALEAVIVDLLRLQDACGCKSEFLQGNRTL